MIFEKLTTLKLICKDKTFRAINGDNSLEVDLLLFTINFAISNLSDKSSC